jgi:hypothetical protein
MAERRKLLVLGPVAQGVIVLAVLGAALEFYALGDRVYVAVLVTGLVSRVLQLLPIARGRPYDVVPKVVTRAVPPPLPPRRDDKE